jgi:hypothetical protein
VAVHKSFGSMINSQRHHSESFPLRSRESIGLQMPEPISPHPKKQQKAFILQPSFEVVVVVTSRQW